MTIILANSKKTIMIFSPRRLMSPIPLGLPTIANMYLYLYLIYLYLSSMFLYLSSMYLYYISSSIRKSSEAPLVSCSLVADCSSPGIQGSQANLFPHQSPISQEWRDADGNGGTLQRWRWHYNTRRSRNGWRWRPTGRSRQEFL